MIANKMFLSLRCVLGRTQKFQKRPLSMLNPGPQMKRSPSLQSGWKDLNKVYVVPEPAREIVYPIADMPALFRQDVDMLGEYFCLIRKPAVSIMDYLEGTDYSKPINKYVLYGKPGNGKSRTVLHLLHYAYESGFILVYVPWPQLWFRFPRQVVPTVNGLYDLPFEAANWLRLFKHQNQHLLKELNLSLSKDCVWSQRDSLPKGTLLEEAIDLGLNRIKYACQVVEALLDELKLASTAGQCKVFIAIDGYNAFVSDYTQVKNAEKRMLLPHEISLTRTFTNALTSNWSNGAAVLVVDKLATKTKRESDEPLYLLGEHGFEYLDPFIPIAVEPYTHEEFLSMIEYYKKRKFIRNLSDNGQLEIELKSCRCPLELMSICKPL